MNVSDVVAASSITALALLIQAGLTNWRDAIRLKSDSAERQKDRDHQTTEAAKTRSQTVVDHWRDERLAAHAEFLAAVEALSRLVNQPSVLVATATSLTGASEGLKAAWSRVQMLGSTESLEAGNLLYLECRNAAYYAMRVIHSDPKTEALAELDRTLDHLDDPLLAYRIAARRDIGAEI